MTKFCYFIKSSDQQRQIIPIGQPIKGAAALVVDERGRICPTGMIGEIYVRTPYRSLGYYQQDALTNEVFVVNPFSNNPNDLIYKTGDMGRVSSDGNFEYLGRKDRQVKIRGIRIELGEIENYLRLSSAIKESAVIDINDTEGNKYLCAYLVLKHSVEVREIREYLRDFLPEMMIPSSFVIMESLPKTISGKIDRKSLPSPTQNNRKYVAPRTPIEIRLAEIWTQVLNIQQIGIDDDFFELGGHSLLATQLVSCISRAWQVEIPLKLLFDSPILATQAESIETLLWMKNHSSALLEELSEEGEL
jgi:long-subunit acyl-CoA synthetase (AMP-forming)